MPTRAAEHHRRQHVAASPMEEHLGEGAMRVSYPGTKILMGDHSLNDFVMPASVTSQILEGIGEHSGIKMYGGAVVHPKTSRFEHVIPDEVI